MPSILPDEYFREYCAQMSDSTKAKFQPLTPKKSVGGFFRWVWWCLYYVVRSRPDDLAGFLISLNRTQWPWKRFKPCLTRYEDVGCWEFLISAEPCYTQIGSLENVELIISKETKKLRD